MLNLRHAQCIRNQAQNSYFAELPLLVQSIHQAYQALQQKEHHQGYLIGERPNSINSEPPSSYSPSSFSSQRDCLLLLCLHQQSLSKTFILPRLVLEAILSLLPDSFDLESDIECPVPENDTSLYTQERLQKSLTYAYKFLSRRNISPRSEIFIQLFKEEVNLLSLLTLMKKGNLVRP